MGVGTEERTARSFWQRAEALGDKPAVIDPDGSLTTFAELYENGNRVANGLAAFELGDDDVVAMVLKNGHVVYEVFSAVLQVGGYFTPVNWHLNADEIAYILRDSGAKAVVTQAEFADVVRPAAEAAGIPVERRLLSGGIADGFTSYELWKAEQSPAAPADRRPGHRLYYTSGTTGKPKAVLKPRPKGDADSAAATFSERLFGHSGLGTGEDESHLVTGPTYHPSPLGYGMAALHFGQTVVLMDKWDAEDTLRLIQERRITAAHFVPTMFHRMLRLPQAVRDAYDVSSLRGVVHAAAPCPPDVKRAMLDWFGPIVWEYYSSSEVGGTQVSPEEWLRRPGTVGRPYPGAELRILDEDGNEQPTGTAGLVHFKLVTPFEYKGDPAKTAAARHGDWVTVGDIGYVDDEGYLFLCDRAAETIISGGVNIYPAEVEAALLAHPSVEDAAVIGVPNEEWGEEVKAVVQLSDGVSGTPELAEELIIHTRERTAKFKTPRSIDFVDELPRGSNGKLLRRRVRAPYWADRTRSI
ncbi:AMP-binding protein [Actinomadura sp. LD22]|uniref:AMP-binding protein n=1 Tax=Actinomadura physcomitrii TaxID=2650748 RepID=A0A6I4MQI3_9ACTN|nr:acyl-CoA synthetase [Actinomadura physcomitrii]MWA06995.1 AMP-binding protein [Actinomadura physcomitrii]